MGRSCAPLYEAHNKQNLHVTDAYQIRNPDGTTTTRNANGVKHTKLAPRRPASAKSQPTSSKSDTDVTRPDLLAVPAGGDSPSAEKVVGPVFTSTIYCSEACRDQDYGSSHQTYEDFVRVFGNPDVATLRTMPSVAPPSPILGSDTDSSASVSGLLAPLSSTPTTTDTIFSDTASVPKGMDYFRMGRRQSDDWKELERKRRSSMNTTPITVTSVHIQLQMSRQRSSTSRSAASAASSDSLSSLWQDQEMHRTMSLSGAVRSMAPIHQEGRHMSTSSEGGNVAGARPFARNNFSQSSLAGMTSPAGSGYVLPAQVGSAPSATAFLMHTYASAFPARDMTISPSLRATPIPGSVTPDNRHSVLASPGNGTVRGSYTPSRSRTNSSATWDAFGKAEIRERQRAARKYSNASEVDSIASSIPREAPSSLDLHRVRGRDSNKDVTPTQSLEMENGGWQIRYGHRSASRSRSRSRTRGEIPRSPALGTQATSIALPIPPRATKASSVSNGISGASATRSGTGTPRTPQSRLRRESRPTRPQSSNALPDLAALRIGASCAADTCVSTETAAGRSVPRAGFDWGASEHKTYELPKGVVVNPNKGLFYFKA